MLGVRDKMEEKEGLVHRRGGGRIVQNMMKMLKIEKDFWSASKKNWQTVRLLGRENSSLLKRCPVWVSCCRRLSAYTLLPKVFTHNVFTFEH